MLSSPIWVAAQVSLQLRPGTQPGYPRWVAGTQFLELSPEPDIKARHSGMRHECYDISTTRPTGYSDFFKHKISELKSSEACEYVPTASYGLPHIALALLLHLLVLVISLGVGTVAGSAQCIYPLPFILFHVCFIGLGVGVVVG